MSAPSSEIPPSLPESPSTGSRIILGFFLFWALAGFAALVMSLVCFGLSGSIMEKIVGLLLAFFLGPFYFIFYGFNKGYCRNMGANVIRTVNTIGGR